MRNGGRLIGSLALVGALLSGGAATAPPAAAHHAATDTIYDGSPDRIDGSVYRLYRAFFLREPDGDGISYWLAQARYGRQSIAAIADNFTRSQEFTSRYGTLSNSQFVDLVYRNVLGRTPDGGGRAYWLDQMARGMPRGNVMVNFSDSLEYGRKVGAGPFGRKDFRGPARPAPSAPPGSWSPVLANPNGDGKPLGWPKCRPIYVRANPVGLAAAKRAPYLSELRAAIDEMSSGTGQDWVFVGTSAFHVTSEDQVNRLVGTVAVALFPNLSAAGYGGGEWGHNPATNRMEIGSGTVLLDQDTVSDYLESTAGREMLRQLMMHELGHVAGLDHVSDFDQIMYPATQYFHSPVWGAGDLAGLARVGSITTAC